MTDAATVEMIQARARDLQIQFGFSNEEAFYLATLEYGLTPFGDEQHS